MGVTHTHTSIYLYTSTHTSFLRLHREPERLVSLRPDKRRRGLSCLEERGEDGCKQQQPRHALQPPPPFMPHRALYGSWTHWTWCFRQSASIIHGSGSDVCQVTKQASANKSMAATEEGLGAPTTYLILPAQWRGGEAMQTRGLYAQWI